MQIELHDRLLDIPRDVLVRVVYQSRTDMDDHELEQVIATPQRNNAATGITGVLVHSDGLLMQVLEGGADVVSALLTVIEDDPRHCDFDLVRLDAVTERSFGDWSMNRIELESRRLIQILYAYINREPGTKQDSRPCAQPRRLRNIRKMRHPLICIAVLLAPDAVAGWTPLGTDGSPEFGYHIDSGAIRQTGPMAIYRQVRVLRQWQAAAASAETTVSVYEYDCMAGRFRTLQVDRFDQPWAVGEAVSLPVPASSSAWQDLPTDVLGRPLFDTLCPSGEGD